MPNWKRRASKLKKLLAIVIGALFVLSFASSAFAVHAEIPAETQAVVAKGETQITMGGLIRVRGWWRKNIVGGLPFDNKSGSWNDQRIRLYTDARVSPNVQGYVMLQGDWKWGSNNQGKVGGVDVLQAFVTYTGSGLFGVPAGLKIGHMPLALGHKTFFEHTNDGDDAIVLFVNPTKQVHISLLSIKLCGDGGLCGGSPTDNTDDTDGYVALITYAADIGTFGANYTYLNNSDGELSLSNLGLHAGGQVAGLGYKGEVNLQFGDVNPTQDAEGWSVMLGVNYKVDPVNLKAEFGYGTGDDGPDVEQFISFLNAVPHYTFVYDYQMSTAGGCTNCGLPNTTYYMVGLDYNPTKNLKTKVNGFLLRASEAPAGTDKDVGWEVDAGLVYTIAKNLKYYFDIGYFDAGDFWGPGADEATAIRQQFILSF
jgi:hypothetical protein